MHVLKERIKKNNVFPFCWIKIISCRIGKVRYLYCYIHVYMRLNTGSACLIQGNTELIFCEVCTNIDHALYSDTKNRVLLESLHAWFLSVIVTCVYNRIQISQITQFLDNKLSKCIQNFDRQKRLINRQDRLEMIKTRYLGVFFIATVN